MSAPRSVRFDDTVLRRLDGYVRSHSGSSASSVINLFVDEALRAEEHPGIVFRAGPSGRRAGLVDGPDIWEVIATLRSLQESDKNLADDSLVEETADSLGLSVRQVRRAVRYYADFRAEIDDRITTNDETASRDEAIWLEERRVLRTDGRSA
jgi:hypothetical protein